MVPMSAVRWLRQRARRRACNGLPSPSLAVELLGFGASSLLTTGSMTTSPPLPNVAGLIGVVLRQQVGALTFDGGGNLLAATSTNAVELTIGTP